MATQIIFDVAGMHIHGLNAEENFSFAKANVVEAIEASVIPQEAQDALYDLSFGAGNDTQVQITIMDSSLCEGVSFTSNNPELFTVDTFGKVTMALDNRAAFLPGAGLGIIIMNANCGGQKKTYIWYTSTRAASSNVPTGFVTGSLGKHCFDALLAMISGKSPGTTNQAYFLTNNGDPDNPIATLNPDRFCASVDLSATSMMRESFGGTDIVPMMLISNQHCIYADHVNFFIGEKVTFMRADGSFQTTTVADLTLVPMLGESESDMGLAYLADPIIGISPYKCMPTGWEAIYAPQLMPANANTVSFPVLRKMMHDNNDVSASWSGISGIYHFEDFDEIRPYKFHDTFAYTEFTGWTNEWNVGDSSSPVFLIINGEPILISYGGAVEGLGGDAGDSISEHKADIETAMDTQAGSPAGTYIIDTLNASELSAFNTYN